MTHTVSLIWHICTNLMILMVQTWPLKKHSGHWMSSSPLSLVSSHTAQAGNRGGRLSATALIVHRRENRLKHCSGWSLSERSMCAQSFIFLFLTSPHRLILAFFPVMLWQGLSLSLSLSLTHTHTHTHLAN